MALKFGLGITLATSRAGESSEGASSGHSRSLLHWITEDECKTEFEVGNNGGPAVFLYILAICYNFLALAIVVDEYFVRSIEVILKKLKISEDLAGAIFMAAGTSAAELFSNLVDTFVYQSNIGFGVIYGTVIFNVFVGIGYASYVCPSDVKKCNWRVMCRDTSWYVFSIVMVVSFIWDKKVEWYESFILVLMYVGYVLSVVYQPRIEALLCGAKATVTTRNKENVMELEEKEESGENSQRHVEMGDHEHHHEKGVSGGDVDVVEPDSSPANPTSLCSKFYCCLTAPLNFLMYWTIPDSGTAEEPTNKYMWAFFVSCLWIAGLSWLMVKFATSIGCILNVGAILLGTTFLAIGTSIPDTMSTIIAARKGQGPIAVSNTLGSNIFDMQIAIGFPWMLYSWIHGKAYAIDHGDMTGPVIFLLLSALVLHFGLSLFGWKLRKRLGAILISLYVVFLIFVFVEEFA
eukprot:CAMPEP_0167784200 /NCGR_PEP_ID=MMETSP0111_2-20121227/7503_1 /TAXON_ID=91324 /ORGANISM="Lotharella globosa, Strain CCCM811" /LENGTH=461 /DNA_ID=CAMNT_0007675241 /DNA_START=1 /DNA_END=1386 /DNA_ORIENTATION=+